MFLFCLLFPFLLLGHPHVKITLGSMTFEDNILYTRKDTFTIWLGI